MKRSRVDAVSPLHHYKWQHQVFLLAGAVGRQTFPDGTFAFSDFLLCFCLQCRCFQRLLHLTPLSRPPSLFPWWARPRQAYLCQEQPPPGKREMTACWSQTRIGWNHSSVVISFSCSYFSGLIRVFKWSLDFRTTAEVSLDPVVSQGSLEEPSQQPDKTNVPSTSQEASSSSAGNVFRAYAISDPFIHLFCLQASALIPAYVFLDTSSVPPKPSRPGPSRQLQRWPEYRGGRGKRGGKGKEAISQQSWSKCSFSPFNSRPRQITVENKGILWRFIQPVYLFLQQYRKILFKQFLRRQVQGFLLGVYTGEDLQDEALIV